MPQQMILPGMQLRDDANLSNFYPAATNADLLPFIKNFLTDATPGCLYLWGQPGCGRSHLLNALCLASLQLAVYLPLQELYAYGPVVLENLEDYPVLCLDDVHLIAGQANWERAIFNLYNQLQMSGRRLAVAADAPPRQLALQLADLQSRLMASTVFHVRVLDDQEKCQALQLRASRRGLHMPDAVAQFLLTHTARSWPALLTVLDKLDHASLAAQRRLSVPFVKTVLANR